MQTDTPKHRADVPVNENRVQQLPRHAGEYVSEYQPATFDIEGLLYAACGPNPWRRGVTS